MLTLAFLGLWFLSWITGNDRLALMLLAGGGVGYVLLLVALDVRDHLGKQGPREAALAEASYGAAMIALPALAYWKIGATLLPSWFPFAVLLIAGFGALKFFRGAKYSVGWRDPVLMVRFAVKLALGLTAWSLIGAFTPIVVWAWQAVAAFLVVTGGTKLLLVLRGFPNVPLVPPGKPPYGDGDFWNPNKHP
jgi:hypothetical protein